MANSASVFEVAAQRAADRFYEVVRRLRLLLGSLLHFPDAFSPDDLPISFILRRDAPSNNRRRRGRRNKTTPFIRRLTAIRRCVQQDIAPRREAHFDLQVIQTYAADTASRYDRRRHIRNVPLARTRP